MRVFFNFITGNKISVKDVVFFPKGIKDLCFGLNDLE